MMKGLPPSLRILIWIQLAISLLFLALGWSHTSSLRFGRSPSFADAVALGAPLVLVIGAALVAPMLARQGHDIAARLVAIAPLPLALALAMLAGVV